MNRRGFLAALGLAPVAATLSKQCLGNVSPEITTFTPSAEPIDYDGWKVAALETPPPFIDAGEVYHPVGTIADFYVTPDVSGIIPQVSFRIIPRIFDGRVWYDLNSPRGRDLVGRLRNDYLPAHLQEGR